MAEQNTTTFQCEIGNKIIDVSTQWEKQDGEWKPTITLNLGDLSNRFIRPKDTDLLQMIINEFNEGDYYEDIPSPNIANVELAHLDSALKLINTNLENTKPQVSVFATENQDSEIFKEGNAEVAVTCEWFSDNGEKWCFVGDIFTSEKQIQIGLRPDLFDIKEILIGLDVPSSLANPVKEYLCKRYDDYPVISAHEGYYGV